MQQRTQVPEALQQLVARLTYKPGWRVWTQESGPGGKPWLRAGELCIAFAAPDTHAPTQTTTGDSRVSIPPIDLPEEAWQRWLFAQLLAVEHHEAAEWFRIDGKQPYDPHQGTG